MGPRDSSLKGHGPSHSPGRKLEAATSSSGSTALHQAICRARHWESRCPGHVCGYLYAWATSAGMPGWWRKRHVSQQGGMGHKWEVVGGTVGRRTASLTGPRGAGPLIARACLVPAHTDTTRALSPFGRPWPGLRYLSNPAGAKAGLLPTQMSSPSHRCPPTHRPGGGRSGQVPRRVSAW